MASIAHGAVGAHVGVIVDAGASRGGEVLALVGGAERLEGEACALDTGAEALLVDWAYVGDTLHHRAGVGTPLCAAGVG